MAQPTIASFTPSTLAGNGAGVVITGTNFATANVTAVVINGTPVSFVITNDTTLTIASTGPLADGVASVAVTNPTGTATNTTGLTITAYVPVARNNVVTPSAVFDTLGTKFTNNLIDQYLLSDGSVWATGLTTPRGYLLKVAKIKAVKLENTRRPAGNLSVPTF